MVRSSTHTGIFSRKAASVGDFAWSASASSSAYTSNRWYVRGSFLSAATSNCRQPGSDLRVAATWRFISSSKAATCSGRSFQRTPEIPTLAETGLPGYDPIGWFGFLAPAGTPVTIVAQLNREAVATLRLPEVRECMHAVALEPWPSTPEEMTGFMRSEGAKWAKVIREANIRVE